MSCMSVRHWTKIVSNWVGAHAFIVANTHVSARVPRVKMPRYYFNCWNSHRITKDVKGAEVKNAYEAFILAVEAARRWPQVLDGTEMDGLRIEIVDDGGRVMFDFTLREAVWSIR